MDIAPFLQNFLRQIRFRTIVIILCVICLIGGALYFLFSSPRTTTASTMIHVSKNETLSDVLDTLKTDHVIRSVSVTKFMVRLLNPNGHIARGDYLFNPYESQVGIAWQIARADHRVDPIRITLKEGDTNAQMADMLAHALPHLDENAFLALANTKQGYLFPDTYFFFPLSTPQEIVDTLTANFTAHIASLTGKIALSGKNETDIITMASLIEKEASGKSDAYLISGILWKRIALGIPLEVDADPATYKEKGLPSAPIGNPSLVSIEASLAPTTSPYLFYLHDKNGMVHYATTFAEHERNIALYLK
jgi:UPF0755 protein